MIVVTNKTLGPNYSPQLLSMRLIISVLYLSFILIINPSIKDQEWMALSGIFVLICVIIPLLCKVIG